MRIDPVIRNERETLTAIVRGLANGVTAVENLSPEGTAGYVLTSNGLLVPPTYQPLGDAVRQILRDEGLIP